MKDYVELFCFYQFLPVKPGMIHFPSAQGPSKEGTDSTKFCDRTIQSMLHPSKPAAKSESCESKGVALRKRKNTVVTLALQFS